MAAGAAGGMAVRGAQDAQAPAQGSEGAAGPIQEGGEVAAPHIEKLSAGRFDRPALPFLGSKEAQASGSRRFAPPGQTRSGPALGVDPHQARSRRSGLVIGLLERGDVELDHPHHGPHDAVGLPGILVPKHDGQDRGKDLPGHAEFVREPAALHGRAAFKESRPVMIDLFLSLAGHGERDGRGEMKLRAAVQGREFLPVQREVDHQDRALLARTCLAVAHHLADFRVLEGRCVETGGFLGLAVEPQAGGDWLHDALLAPEHLAFPGYPCPFSPGGRKGNRRGWDGGSWSRNVHLEVTK